MLERLQENIEKQRAAVTKMADVDVPEVAGLEMLEGQLKLTGLNREMVDAFVEEIVVYVKDRVEIKWKFKDEFWEVRKVEKIEYSVENMEMGWYNCTHESISLEMRCFYDSECKKVKDVGVLRIMKLRKQDYRRISARRILYMVLIHMENLHYVIFLKMFQMMQQIVFKKTYHTKWNESRYCDKLIRWCRYCKVEWKFLV